MCEYEKLYKKSWEIIKVFTIMSERNKTIVMKGVDNR